jgi:hypothetical protein
VARHAEHAHETVVGHLHDVAGVLVDGHGLAGRAIGAENEPLAVRGPLHVRLVDLRIAMGCAGQKRQRHARDRIGHDLLFGWEALADAIGQREGRQQQRGQTSEETRRAQLVFHGRKFGRRLGRSD